MSAGARIPLAMARPAAGYLLRCWGVAESAVIVGSVRRGKPDVGDLEVCAPLEPAEHDTLFKTLHAAAGQQDGLFGGPSDQPPLTVVKGLRPGFRQAGLIAHVSYEGRPFELPVEVYRSEEGARGWSILMRTGPTEFGQWFLGRWKRYFEIPSGKPASAEGWLVDRYGARVPCPTEEDCFERIRSAFIAPDRRDTFIQTLRST